MVLHITVISSFIYYTHNIVYSVPELKIITVIKMKEFVRYTLHKIVMLNIRLKIILEYLIVSPLCRRNRQNSIKDLTTFYG